MIIPQIILIPFLNHIFFPDSLKSKIAPRILVMIERMPMPNDIVNIVPRLVLAAVGLDIMVAMMIVEHKIAKNWTIQEIILIAFANPLCFIASLSKRIAHQIAPIMKMILTTWSKVHVETVVGIEYRMKG